MSPRARHFHCIRKRILNVLEMNLRVNRSIPSNYTRSISLSRSLPFSLRPRDFFRVDDQRRRFFEVFSALRFPEENRFLLINAATMSLVSDLFHVARPARQTFGSVFCDATSCKAIFVCREQLRVLKTLVGYSNGQPVPPAEKINGAKPSIIKGTSDSIQNSDGKSEAKVNEAKRSRRRNRTGYGRVTRFA